MATLLTNSGRAILTNLVSGVGGTVAKFHSWGTGTTAAAVTDTALQTASTETSTTRVTGTAARVTTSVTNDTYSTVATITSTQTQAITEMGVFDQAAAGGNMLIHSVFAAINVVNLDSIQFTVTLQFT